MHVQVTTTPSPVSNDIKSRSQTADASNTKKFAAIVRELLYADDSALMAHTQKDAQCL